MVEGHGLLGQHGRVSHGVAEHEVTETEMLGMRPQPHGRRHRLVHRLVLRHGRRQMVDQGDSSESVRLGVHGPVGEVFDTEPHLR
jgi:hypothetical protein